MTDDIKILRIEEYIAPWITLFGEAGLHKTRVSYEYNGKKGSMVSLGKLDQTEESLKKSISFVEFSRQLHGTRKAESKRLLEEFGTKLWKVKTTYEDKREKEKHD